MTTVDAAWVAEHYIGMARHPFVVATARSVDGFLDAVESLRANGAQNIWCDRATAERLAREVGLPEEFDWLNIYGPRPGHVYGIPIV